MTGDWRVLTQAETLLDLNRYEDAASRFRQVLSEDPGSVPALIGLGRALTGQGGPADLEQAEQALRQAVALAPEESSAYNHLSDVLCLRRDGDAAVAAATRALQLAPHSFVSHYQYARSLLALRRPRVRDAYVAALRAVDLAPTDPDCHNLVGLCLDRLGHHDQAQQAFRNALALDPTHTLAQNNLAATELDRGRLGRAAGMLRTAVGNDPRDEQIRGNLDVVLLLLGRRVMWSLIAAAIVLAILLVNEAPWWSRALAGAAYAGAVVVVLRPFRQHLPRGVSRWGRGLFGRVDWRGRYLMGLLILLSAGVLLLALAPYPVAVAAGIALATTLRILGLVCVLGWIGYALVNLVRGR